jgi:hypothetical protein
LKKLTVGQLIAAHGKKLRRSHDQAEGKAADLHGQCMGTQNQMVWDQTKVADKSNEISAIPEFYNYWIS